MAMFSVGSSIGRPSSERGKPRRQASASAGAATKLTPLSPRRWLKARIWTSGPTGASVIRRSTRVPREGVEQLLGAGLAADDLDRLGEPKGGRDQALGHQLLHHVGDTHDEVHRAAGGRPADGLDHLPAGREDLVGVAVDEPAHLGEDEPTAGLAEELLGQDSPRACGSAR